MSEANAKRLKLNARDTDIFVIAADFPVFDMNLLDEFQIEVKSTAMILQCDSRHTAAKARDLATATNEKLARRYGKLSTRTMEPLASRIRPRDLDEFVG